MFRDGFIVRMEVVPFVSRKLKVDSNVAASFGNRYDLEFHC